jgi:hypothetical protein
MVLEDHEALLADGFDDALIGYTVNANVVAVYDFSKCVEILSSEMSHEDAVDHMYYNVVSAYVGDKTPIFVMIP